MDKRSNASFFKAIKADKFKTTFINLNILMNIILM